MNTARSSILRIITQVVLLLSLYCICRLIFVIVNSQELNLTSSLATAFIFIGGLRFDLAAIAAINSLFIVLALLPAPFTGKVCYQKLLQLVFILSNSFFLLLNVVDIAYFPFIHKRMQADVFLFVDGEKGNDLFKLLPAFLLQYWPLALLFGLLVWILFRGYRLTILFNKPAIASLKNYIYSIATFITAIGISVIAIRGGLQLKPLNIIHASEMTSVQNIPAIINSPFSVIKTMNRKGLKEMDYFPATQISDEDCLHAAAVDSFTKQNIVLIIVESLSREHIGFFNGKGDTPFLDSLFRESLVFENGFANAKESIQGIPAILSSIPSWQDEPFIFSKYSGNRITSLPNLLKSKGYTCSFFHGGSNGTMGFNSYCTLAGFDNYYGRTEYNNEADYDGHWGIWDEPFLQYMAAKLSEMQEPFFSTVFTLNTHHPFSIPDRYKKALHHKDQPFLACVRYADLALRAFFETAEKTSWFDNTLFIITADHTAPNTRNAHGAPLNDYRLPIVFYHSGSRLKGINQAIANQIDILPTVMHLVHYPDPYFSMGTDLLDNDAPKFSINYNAGIYQYIDSVYCYQFNGQDGLGLYNWRSDSMFTHNMHRSISYEKQCDQRLKRKIQLFNHRMIANELYYDVKD